MCSLQDGHSPRSSPVAIASSCQIFRLRSDEGLARRSHSCPTVVRSEPPMSCSHAWTMVVSAVCRRVMPFVARRRGIRGGAHVRLCARGTYAVRSLPVQAALRVWRVRVQHLRAQFLSAARRPWRRAFPISKFHFPDPPCSTQASTINHIMTSDRIFLHFIA